MISPSNTLIFWGVVPACYLPFVILWWKFMKPIMLAFGFDAETAQMGKEYTLVYATMEMLNGLGESIHALLDCIDLENYSTLIGVAEEVITFVDILILALVTKPKLYVIGLIELLVAFIFIGVNIGSIAYRGWFEPYREGLIGSCSLCNRKAVCQVLNTSSSLSFGYLMTDGEV